MKTHEVTKDLLTWEDWCELKVIADERDKRNDYLSRQLELTENEVKRSEQEKAELLAACKYLCANVDSGEFSIKCLDGEWKTANLDAMREIITRAEGK